MKDAGVRPRFPPECKDAGQARERILIALNDSPTEHGFTASRWSLRRMVEALDWLDLETESGMWGLLNRLGITYQRGRSFVESPDENFAEKCELIEQRRDRARGDDREVIIYFDEVQYYQNPQVAGRWNSRGDQPTVDRAAVSKYGWSRHALCAVDIDSGQLFWRHEPSFDRWLYVDLYEQLVESYPQANRITVVQDNLPVHFHVDVFDSLEAQQWPWDFYFPASWTDPNPTARAEGELNIQVTPLPTYASWLNPVERLWRQLKRQVLYMHDDGRNPQKLERKVTRYFEELEDKSEQVLQTTSLSCA